MERHVQKSRTGGCVVKATTSTGTNQQRAIRDTLRHSRHSLRDVAHGRELVEGPDKVHGAVEDQLLKHDAPPLQVVFLFRTT